MCSPVSDPSTKRANAECTDVVHLVATVTTLYLYFFKLLLTATTQDEKFLPPVSFLHQEKPSSRKKAHKHKPNNGKKNEIQGFR